MNIQPKIPNVVLDEIQVLSGTETSSSSGSTSQAATESTLSLSQLSLSPAKAKTYSSHVDIRAYMESQEKKQTGINASKDEEDAASIETATPQIPDDASESNNTAQNRHVATAKKLESTWNLHRLKEPPIRIMTVSETRVAITKMEANIVDWIKPIRLKPMTPGMSEQEKADWYRDLVEIRDRHQRGENTSHMLNAMRDDNLDSEKFIGYFLSDEPTGILIANRSSDRNDIPYIEAIVTHPGSWRCGGILIEKAVQISDKEWNKGGKIRLYSANPEATKVYKALGFVRERPGSDYMVLDPSSEANKGRWSKVNKEWKLTKHIGQEYFGKRDPKPETNS